MPSWGEIENVAPDLARLAHGLLEAHVHKTLATLRADGSPRISGIEAKFIEGELWFGSMPGSRKGTDLLRDPRFALHSGSIDPPGWQGDAKLSGIAEEIVDPVRKGEIFRAMGAEARMSVDSLLFRADVREVAVTRLTAAGDGLAIDFWNEAAGARSLTGNDGPRRGGGGRSAAALPWVDEHAAEIDAPVSVVWPALLRTVERMTAGAAAPRYARAVGCADTGPGGPRPLEIGSTVPGFHVAALTPGRVLVLAGSHRFSDYALVFRLEPLGGVRTRLVAETRADFPGALGRAYRAPVIGTRMHVLVIRRVLRAVAAPGRRAPR